jgi:3-methyladenine DNA glycosylase AlkD
MKHRLPNALMAPHAEVMAALAPLGNPARGLAIAADRGSQLQHLGIGFPALRARVKQGFSFSGLALAEQLPIWNGLWQHSACADVLFAAIEYLSPIVRKAKPVPDLWPTLRHWPGRLDNWCHSDALSSLVSRQREAGFDGVDSDLAAWNAGSAIWPRRLSLTALIHYSGKHAVYLPPAVMLPRLEACVEDHRPPIALALGWVLRELGKKHPADLDDFLREHGARMSTAALRRARG